MGPGWGGPGWGGPGWGGVGYGWGGGWRRRLGGWGWGYRPGYGCGPGCLLPLLLVAITLFLALRVLF